MKIKDKTNPIFNIIQERIKALNKLFRQKHIKAKITSANNDYSKIDYYLTYTGVICSKEIIAIVDDISIALGGRKVAFAPVVEGYKGSLITQFKSAKEIEEEQGLRY